MNVFEYLSLNPQDKLEYFMNTRSSLGHLASYWIDFGKVQEHIDRYDLPDLYTLDYLIGKPEKEISDFFKSRPSLLKLVPKLLGIRDSKFEKGTSSLKIQDIDGIYFLDFKKINLNQLDLYIKFIIDSGLSHLLSNGIKKSIHDYSLGIESGMNSNARKNRSGNAGEDYLSKLLQDVANKLEWEHSDQTTTTSILKKYDLKLENEFSNRRFDGSLFNPRKKKLYLFEINNFNSSGSKSKSSATEFRDLQSRFSRTNHEFIYITDGRGWDSDQSHLKESMEHIGKVFNYKMISDGYLLDYLK